MNVKVLAIEPQANVENAWSVKLSVGDEAANYIFHREAIQIGDLQGWGWASELNFRKAFQFNQHVGIKVTNLVQQVANAEIVSFPVEIGKFYTPEEAQAEMARRRGEDLEIAG